MMYQVWFCLEEVPYCFSWSSVKFQGHAAKKIVDCDPDWVFPDCNWSLTSPMYLKWCTKLHVVKKRCPRSSVNFLGDAGQEIANFDPNWAIPGCNSSLNKSMALKCCTKLNCSIEEVPYCFSRSSIKFQGHADKNSPILTRIERFRTVSQVWLHR